MQTFGFSRIHSVKAALYSILLQRNPIIRDDEEVLVQLSAYAATLTPRTTA